MRLLGVVVKLMTRMNPSKFKKLKKAKSGIQMRIEAMEELIFLTSDTKKTFNQLR